jgi:hypothetical protein
MPQASEEPAPLEATKRPTGRGRTVAYVVIGVAIALQLLVPLRYYLGDDPYDERFSWRMFSEVRVVSCRAEAFETARAGHRREVPLMQVIHEAWKTTLERNRETVVHAFLRRRCEDSATRRVELTNHCVSAAGRELPPLTWSIDCESQTIEPPPPAVLAEVRSRTPEGTDHEQTPGAGRQP